MKPREWLIKEAFVGPESGTRYPAHVSADLNYGSYEGDMIHVIEKSSYDELSEAAKAFLKDFSLDWYVSVMGQSEKPEGHSTGISAKIHNQQITDRMYRNIERLKDLLHVGGG